MPKTAVPLPLIEAPSAPDAKSDCSSSATSGTRALVTGARSLPIYAARAGRLPERNDETMGRRRRKRREYLPDALAQGRSSRDAERHVGPDGDTCFTQFAGLQPE